MALDQPFPDLDELLTRIGVAGQPLGSIDASDGKQVERLTPDELREVVAAFDVPTTLV